MPLRIFAAMSLSIFAAMSLRIFAAMFLRIFDEVRAHKCDIQSMEIIDSHYMII